MFEPVKIAAPAVYAVGDVDRCPTKITSAEVHWEALKIGD